MTSAGAISIDLVVNSKAFENKVKQITKGTEKSFDNSFSKVGSAIAAAFSVAAVTSFAKSAINAATEVQAAWTGLNSIVQGTGNSFAVAQKFINEYTKDGLVSVEETATAYKNLLSRGYSTEQIEKTLLALKDSAAFGRQASYDLGEAVVSATEGLKNENSILVDNAGVTKNVAKMWEEYAKSIGKSVNELTQAEKIQAEYNGIINETRFQMGDAATYTKTFGGQVQVLKGNFSTMQAAIGKVVAPIAGLFIPYINAAISAVTAFAVRMQQVLKVFGLEMPDVVTKASSSIGNVGSAATKAAQEVSSTGTAAKKAAKEMKRAFGGMDEINVLNPNKGKDTSGTSGSSGVGGSADAGLGGIGAVAAPTTDPVSSAIGATAERIKSFVEPLQNISFDNLINAFNRLKDALAPFAEKVGAGLEWLWFNVLVPVTTWTIEDAIPAFLNLLSGAFDVLNPLLQSFANIFTPVWNNLLQPLLSWTGGVIVDTINLVADALSKIGSWMSENQSVVDTMVISLGTFFGLWKITELMAFIQMSGGVTGAFKLLTAAINTNIIAKVKDVAQTAILTAMYAKDFVVSLAKGTAAIAKQVVQWGLSTAAMIANKVALVAGTVATTAATAATWLFNTALAVLTSPITLVVAAIAALIAIVVLLVKNWDTVKEVAANVWKGIQNVWNTASNWFNTKVVQPIAKFFTGLWNGLKESASNCWNGILSLFSKGGKIFGGVVDGVAGVFKTIVNTLISGINKIIAAPFNTINSLLNTIRGISVAGIKPFKGLWSKNPLPVPQIPKLAQGGWLPANNPQLAIVGDNKREAEIVAPESKIYDQVAKAIKDTGGVGKQQIEITIYHKYEDGRTIIQKVNQAQIDAGEVLLLT